MSRVQKLDRRLREVALERLRPRWDEDRVVLAPDDESWGLPLAEVGLELGVQVNVGAVVVEEVELDFVVPWTVYGVVVQIVGLRGDNHSFGSTADVL